MTMKVPGRMALPMTRSTGAGLALAAAFVSGVAIFVNEYAVRQAPDAASYTTAKNLVAALLLLTIAATSVRGGPVAALRRLSYRQLLALLAIGVFAGGIAFVLFFEGLRHATATDAALVQKSLVIWVAIAAVPLLGERLRVAHVAAVALLLLGQVLLLGSAGSWSHSGGGELMILIASLIWSGEIVAGRILLRTIPSQVLAMTRMVIGCAFLLAYLAVSGQAAGLAALGAGGWSWALITGSILAVYVATWLAALARAPAVDVTAILVAGAFITALLDAIAGHSSLAPHAAGLVLIVAGTAAMVTLTLRTRTPAVVM